MPKKPTEPAPESEPVWLFPFHAMAVGESFFIPTMRPSYMQYVVENSAKRAKVKVKCYRRVEDNVLGVRAWRVS